MKRAIVVLAVLGMVGCGPADDGADPLPGIAQDSYGCPILPEGCDFEARGTCIQVDELRAAGWSEERLTPIPAQVETMIDLSAEFWERDDLNALIRGWTIRFRPAAFLSPTGKVRGGQFWGSCGRIRLIELQAMPGCAPAILPHEIGHLLTGDYEHAGFRWPYVPYPTKC